MNVLMLGWEYPPHIAGGLGTACKGLTTALSEHNITIHFVVPHLFGGEDATHMLLTDARDSTRQIVNQNKTGRGDAAAAAETAHSSMITREQVAALLHPYWTPSDFKSAVSTILTDRASKRSAKIVKQIDEVTKALLDGEVYGVDVATAVLEYDWFPKNGGPHYGSTIFEEVERFTAHVVNLTSGRPFDVIHAHDWMTFPAGVALAQITGKPLVVHIHSLEHDRSGYSINEQINQIERFGLEAANKVIAVSYYTARSIQRYHSIPAEKIAVVHNGVYPRQAVQGYKLKKTWPRNVVLFLGRVTQQKGPDFFVEVAARVIPLVPDVLFVLAGSGDMLPGLIERVQVLGLDDNFLFPGFLKGEELEEMFSIADLYVMPSTSEPFGIAALEAVSFDTPVIVSRQSGVSEVLSGALKADFWDVDRMADLIVNSLLHEELRTEMLVQAKEEIKLLHWDASARKTLEVYREVL
jgi:glycogen(starch) synthase